MFCVDWFVSSIPALSHLCFLLLILNFTFACLAESLIDRAIELQAIGGVYGNNKPAEFMCLLLKLLQIQPEKEILVEYLQAEEFKCALLLSHTVLRE